MLTSMTGFAALSGSGHGYSWHWEVRSVNAKGLDLRVRFPDWLTQLDQPTRKAFSAVVGRGSVSIGLRIAREAGEIDSDLNLAALDRVLDVIARIEDRAGAKGVTLTPASAATVLGFRGVMDAPQRTEASPELCAALNADLDQLITAFQAMRTAEGQALTGILTRQLDEIADLVSAAQAGLDQRAAEMRAGFETALARIWDTRGDFDEQRIAQEIAVLAVKSDVTEEIDRLVAHIAAARDMLAATGPIGRKLDFLMQEFNREANTLCSKSQNTALTDIGLRLKVLIDQMREQVQNVE